MHRLALFVTALLVVGVQSLGTCTFGNGYISITTGNGAQTEPALKVKQTGSYVGNLFQVYNASGDLATISSAGVLTKPGGTFDIPHPLKGDPLQRLRHSFVESPLVDNIYTGESQLRHASLIRRVLITTLLINIGRQDHAASVHSISDAHTYMLWHACHKQCIIRHACTAL
jgi:hypothetical protein